MADAKEMVERGTREALPVDREIVLAKKGLLHLKMELPEEGERCLHCRSHCESCVDVCPNRANLAIAVGLPRREIVHIDALCNYCGNCEAFCPYNSRPYLEKFTVFRTKLDFENSIQPGVWLDEPNNIRGEKTEVTQRVIEKLLADHAWLKGI